MPIFCLPQCPTDLYNSGRGCQHWILLIDGEIFPIDAAALTKPLAASAALAFCFSSSCSFSLMLLRKAAVERRPTGVGIHEVGVTVPVDNRWCIHIHHWGSRRGTLTRGLPIMSSGDSGLSVGI